MLVCGGAYFTTMWHQTTELFLPFHKEFNQDECSANVDSGFSGSGIIGQEALTFYVVYLWTI